MDHATITKVNDKYVKIIPHPGYGIKRIADGRIFSEVITEDISRYTIFKY